MHLSSIEFPNVAEMRMVSGTVTVKIPQSRERVQLHPKPLTS